MVARKRWTSVVLLLLFAVCLRANFLAFSAYNMVESRSANCDCSSSPESAGSGAEDERLPCDDRTEGGADGGIGQRKEYPWFGSNMARQRESVCRASEGIQADKFLIIVTDALSERAAEPLLQRVYNHHSRAFAVRTPGARWSHSIYSAYFTGQRNSNFLDLALTSVDNVFAALRRAKRRRAAAGAQSEENGGSSAHPSDARDGQIEQRHKVWWVGPFVPILRLFAPSDDEQSRFFEEFNGTDSLETLHSPGSDVAMERGWNDFDICDLNDAVLDREADAQDPAWPRAQPALFAVNGTRERERRLFDWLDTMKSRGQSLFAYTATLDGWQHDGDIVERCGWPRIVRRATADLTLFKGWVDANPEYLLVLMSDHGQNVRTPFRLHGEGGGGNDGIFLAYSPKMFQDSQPGIGQEPLPQLLISDVSASLTALLRGVDFPLASIGLPFGGGGGGREPSRETGGIGSEGEIDEFAFSRSMLAARSVMQLVRSAKLRGVGGAETARAIALLDRLFPRLRGSTDSVDAGESVLRAAASDPRWNDDVAAVANDLRFALLNSDAALYSMITPVMALLLCMSWLPCLSVLQRLRGDMGLDIAQKKNEAILLFSAGLYALSELGFTWSDWRDVYESSLVFCAGMTVFCGLLFWRLPQLLSLAAARGVQADIKSVVVLIVAAFFVPRVPIASWVERPGSLVLTALLLVVLLGNPGYRTAPLQRKKNLRVAATLLVGELVPFTRAIPFLWFPAWIPVLGGVQFLAALALAGEFWVALSAAHVGNVNEARSPPIRLFPVAVSVSSVEGRHESGDRRGPRLVTAASASVAAVMSVVTPALSAVLLHTWFVYSEYLAVRLVMLIALASLVPLHRVSAAVSSTSSDGAAFAFGALAFAVSLAFGTLTMPVDMEVQADFSRWGVTDTDKHVPLNAYSMALSKFGLVMPLFVQLHLFALRSQSAGKGSRASEFFAHSLVVQQLGHGAVAVIALRVIQRSMSQAHRPDEAFLLTMLLCGLGVVQMGVTLWSQPWLSKKGRFDPRGGV